MKENSQVELLFLAVAYGNRKQVREFCSKVRIQFGAAAHVAVCDNTPEPDEQFDFGADSQSVRPDNPGYWEGGLVALEDYSKRHSRVPEWIALANTDLEFETPRMLEILRIHGTSWPMVLAPRITEGDTEKNPHIMRPRDRRRLWINHVLTSSMVGALMYLIVSRLRSGVRLGQSRGVQIGLPPEGVRMYAPYGALVIFNRSFLTVKPLWRNVPLLAEEWAIAEMARERSAFVIFVPSIFVRHDPHQTTGGTITIRRAVMLRRAFRFIWEHA